MATVATNSAGEPIYNTPNGQRTASEMAAELFNVGWNGQGSITDAYARTTGGAVSATGGTSTGAPTGSTASPGTSSSGSGTYANTGAASVLLQQAQAAANQAYLNARLALDTDDLAFRKATQAFQNTISEAQLTGSYNGSPTLAAQQQAFNEGNQQQQTAINYLQLVSGLKGPQDYGAYLRTLASTPQGLKDLVASAAGQYIPGSGTTGVQPTPSTVSGMLAQIGGNAVNLPSTASQVPGMTPGAPGPAAQAAAAGATTVPSAAPAAAPASINPNSPMLGVHETFANGQWIGLRKDLYGADNVKGDGMIGQYNAATGVIEPRTWNDYVHAGAPPTVDMSKEHFAEMQTPAPAAPAAPASAAVASTPAPAPVTPAAAPTADPSQVAYADYLSQAASLPAPNQISAASWNTYTPSQKAMLLGMYNERGYNTDDVQNLFAQSLPKYSYSGTGAIKV